MMIKSRMSFSQLVSSKSFFSDISWLMQLYRMTSFLQRIKSNVESWSNFVSTMSPNSQGVNENTASSDTDLEAEQSQTRSQLLHELLSNRVSRLFLLHVITCRSCKNAQTHYRIEHSHGDMSRRRNFTMQERHTVWVYRVNCRVVKLPQIGKKINE